MARGWEGKAYRAEVYKTPSCGLRQRMTWSDLSEKGHSTAGRTVYFNGCQEAARKWALLDTGCRYLPGSIQT
jgi:hypothetical protein